MWGYGEKENLKKRREQKKKKRIEKKNKECIEKKRKITSQKRDSICFSKVSFTTPTLYYSCWW